MDHRALEPALTVADRKGGFPHSEISGSKGARASPELIAACHVLHRLSTPRHPSEALMRLIVLSKTHAWGKGAGSRTKSFPRPHMRFDLLFARQLMSSIKSTLYLQPFGDGPTLHSRCQTRRAPNRPGAGIRLSSRSPGHLPWWSQTGSNRRPHACKARALPTELWPRHEGGRDRGFVIPKW